MILRAYNTRDVSEYPRILYMLSCSDKPGLSSNFGSDYLKRHEKQKSAFDQPGEVNLSV